MNKLFFILVFVFSFNFCFSQTSTERWNEYKKQYEYFDSNGNMTAYKVYNSYKRQWETYTVQSNNYQPQPLVNTELVQKTLSTLQDRYDYNFGLLNKIMNNILESFLIEAREKGYSKEYGLKVAEIYKTNYINKVLNSNYDLSSKATTDSLAKYLMDGAVSVSMKYFP